MQNAFVDVTCVAIVNEQLELGMCHCVFVFPAGRSRRKRVAIVLPTALFRNIACSAYA